MNRIITRSQIVGINLFRVSLETIPTNGKLKFDNKNNDSKGNYSNSSGNNNDDSNNNE